MDHSIIYICIVNYSVYFSIHFLSQRLCSMCNAYIIFLPSYTYLYQWPCFPGQFQSKPILWNPPQQHWGRWLKMTIVFEDGLNSILRCVGCKVIVLTELCVFCMKSWISKQKHIEIFPTFKPLWEEGWVSPPIDDGVTLHMHVVWTWMIFSMPAAFVDNRPSWVYDRHQLFMWWLPCLAQLVVEELSVYTYLLYWIQHILTWTLPLTNSSPFSRVHCMWKTMSAHIKQPSIIIISISKVDPNFPPNAPNSATGVKGLGSTGCVSQMKAWYYGTGW